MWEPFQAQGIKAVINKIVQGMREAVAYAKGESDDARETPAKVGVKAIRSAPPVRRQTGSSKKPRQDRC